MSQGNGSRETTTNNPAPGMMSIEDAKNWQYRHGEEIRDLAAKGDRVAQKVIAQYMVWWERKDAHDRKVAEDAAREWIKWLNEYIVRHLTIGGREEVKSKFDVGKDDHVILDIYGGIISKRDIN